MTTLIIPSASWNAYKRDPNPQGQFWNSLVTLIIGTYLILEVLILAGGIKTIPSQIIPITGMIVSNGMVAIGFCLKTMQPSADSIKTMDLVSLPGTMSGLIFAGIDPVYAIKYQIMVASCCWQTPASAP